MICHFLVLLFLVTLIDSQIRSDQVIGIVNDVAANDIIFVIDTHKDYGYAMEQLLEHHNVQITSNVTQAGDMFSQLLVDDKTLIVIDIDSVIGRSSSLISRCRLHNLIHGTWIIIGQEEGNDIVEHFARVSLSLHVKLFFVSDCKTGQDPCQKTVFQILGNAKNDPTVKVDILILFYY